MKLTLFSGGMLAIFSGSFECLFTKQTVEECLWPSSACRLHVARRCLSSMSSRSRPRFTDLTDRLYIAIAHKSGLTAGDPEVRGPYVIHCCSLQWLEEEAQPSGISYQTQ